MSYDALVDALLGVEGVEAIRRGEVGSVLEFAGVNLAAAFLNDGGGYAYRVHTCPSAAELFTAQEGDDLFVVVDVDADADGAQLRSLLRQGPAFVVVPTTARSAEELAALVTSDMGIVALPLIVCG